MAQVKRLTVRGYKSISALEDFELRSLSVLIGANGAGKSNFISLFRMLSELVRERLQIFVYGEGGPDALLFGTRKRTNNIETKVEFEGHGYQFSLEPSGDRLVFASEEILDLTNSGPVAIRTTSGAIETMLPQEARSPFAAYILKTLAGWRVFHFNDTSRSARVRLPQPVRQNQRLAPDGENLAPFLRHLRAQYPESYDRIVRTVRMVAPFFHDFFYRKDPGERVELEWVEVSNPEAVLSARQLSDGTLRFICLATLLLQPQEMQPDTIFIDEPELGLHPYALAVVAGLLRQAADSRQLIVSTQSVELINEFQPEDIVIVDRQDGASTFKRLDSQELADWLKDYALGELWERNIVGGGPAR